MTLQGISPVLTDLMNSRQKHIDLNKTAWKTYSEFYTKGIVQNIAHKKTILTSIADADADILDDITALITSLNGIA